MRVVRLKPYLRAMKRMGVDEAGMRRLESGVRKARFALPGRGKSGGGRAIYYVAIVDTIFMMTAYPKNEQDDLSPEQRKAILAAIESMKGSTS